MRILIISQYFWPETFIINSLSINLKTLGHELTVLTSIPSYPEGIVYNEYRSTPSFFKKFNGIKIHRVHGILARNTPLLLGINYLSFLISASIYSLLKFRKEEYDLIITFQPTPVTSAFPAYFMKIFFNISNVIWIQDIWPETLSAVGYKKNSFIYYLGELVSSLIYKNVDLALIQSKGYAKKISQYLNNKSKIFYFPNYTNQFTTFKDNKIRTEIQSSNDYFDILFTGNIGMAQDFPSVINAISALKEKKLKIHWHFVGSGNYLESLKSAILRNKLNDVAFVYKRKPIEEMHSFFQSVDALFLSLGKNEAFSLTVPAKLQHYLGGGRPIIAMINGSSAQIIKSAKCGLVSDAGDVQALVANIMRMQLMPKLQHKEMADNGARYAKKFFSESSLLQGLNKILYKEKNIFINERPKFLVLLAAFNGDKFINEQVLSILNQKYVNLSIIISIDKSDDYTEKCALDLSLKFENIRIIKNAFNLKKSKASVNFFNLINYVNKFETFDYIALSDQDDIWDYDKLIRAHSKIMLSKASGYSSNVSACFSSGKEKLIKKSYPQKSLDYIFESAGPGCTYVLKRDLFMHLKKFILTTNHEELCEVNYHDWFIYAFARVNRYKWVIDSQVTMKYRQHEKNVVGARIGIRSYFLRINSVIKGEALYQAILLDKILCKNKSFNFNLINLISNIRNLRRNPLDQFFLFMAIFVAYFFPKYK